MSTSRTAWILGGSLFAVVSIGWGTATVVDSLAHERSTQHAEFTSVVALDIDNGAGTIHIEGTDGDTVTVDADVSEGLRDGDHTARMDGHRLVIRAHCPTMFSTWCGVDYTIHVPRATTVVATASDSGITIRGIDGDVHASSSDGGVSATDLRSATVAASASDGGVRLEFSAPPQQVSATSSDGSVTVVVPDTPDAYRVDATSSDGGTDVSVRTDPASTHVIDAHAGDGSVTVRYP